MFTAVCAAQLTATAAHAEGEPAAPTRGTVQKSDDKRPPVGKRRADPKPKPPEPKPGQVGTVAQPEPIGDRTQPIGDRAGPNDSPSEPTRGTTHVRGEEPARTRGREVAPTEPKGEKSEPSKKKKPAPTYGDPPAK